MPIFSEIEEGRAEASSVKNEMSVIQVTKNLLRKSQKDFTVTHFCQLFTDKSCIKVSSKASQNVVENCDGRLKIVFLLSIYDRNESIDFVHGKSKKFY
jgi:hypothetical protein